jgi:NO-binding membrane sensor protein with MHYT domain
MHFTGMSATTLVPNPLAPYEDAAILAPGNFLT